MQRVLFDLPEVIEDAKNHIDFELAGQWHLEAGDFLPAVPTGADAYLMRYILHDWDDESCIKILRNCRVASKNARVLLVERVLQPNHNP